jgi:hypothetical protein
MGKLCDCAILASIGATSLESITSNEWLFMMAFFLAGVAVAAFVAS